MRNRLVPFLSAMVALSLALPAWAQQPPPPEPAPAIIPAPIPATTPTQLLGPPNEVPPGPPAITQPPPPVIIQPAISGNSGSCGSGGSGGIFSGILGTADPCGCPHGSWSASGGLYYMQPFFSSSPAFFTTRTAGTGNFASHQQDFSQRMNVAPMFSFGYTWASGFGVRANFFSFEGNGQAGGTINSNGNTSGSVFPATGSLAFGITPNVGNVVKIDASSFLHMHVYDAEFTYTTGGDRWSVLFGAGVRYASISQDYQLNVKDNSTGNTSSFYAYHNFGGAGPTVSIEGRHQLWCSPFALYGSARGSLLFGSGTQVSSANAPDLGAYSSGSGNQTTVLPVGEIELGAEWATDCGRLHFFAQIGVVGQVWFNGGNASQSLYLSTGAGSGSSQSNSFGFLGGVFRAGVNF